MKKTFKKAIAVLLAVLMVAFSVPFTALAATGDYNPNIKLLFGTAGNVVSNGLLVGEGAYDAPTSKNTDASDNLMFVGLYGAPLDYTYTKTGNTTDGETVSGTLSLDPAKAQGFVDYMASMDMPVEAPTTTTQLGVGDYFVVTVAAEGVSKANVLETRLLYSSNIEPAGVYGYGAVTKRNYQYRALSELDGTEKATAADAAAPLATQNSGDFYSKINDVAGDLSEFDADARAIHTSAVASVPACDVSTTAPSADSGLSFMDPETGAANYTYTDTMILETYMFKIVGEGPIDFQMQSNVDGLYTNGYYIADQADGVAQSLYTTYTPLPQADAPGSEKMTFMKQSTPPTPPACEHDYTSAVTTPATCTQDGVKTFTCSKCGDSYTEPITANGHTEEAIPAVAPTCTVDGSTAGVKCSVCGTIITAPSVDPAKGHTEEAIPAVAATCTATGLTAGVKCSVCGEIIKAQEVVSKIPHDYTSAVTTPATCTEKGVKTFTCSVCKDSYTEEITPNGHTEVEIPAVAPTCTVDGSTAGVKCSVCGEILTAPTVDHATGHNYTSVVTTEPTCTEKGVKTFTCSKCGDSYTEEIAAKGHTEVEIPAVAATCTETGLTAGVKCSVCDTIITAQTETPANGHDYQVKSSTAADCQTVGTTTYECSVCHATKTDESGYGPHGAAVSANNAVAATCTTAGKEADMVCPICNEVLTAGKEIPAKGHTEQVVPGKAATCTDTGLTDGKVCTVCGVTTVTQEEIPAKGHTEVEIPAVPATCTETGLTAGVKCSVCDAIITAPTETPANGHTEVSANNAVAPTVDAAGKEADTVCSVCGALIKEGAVIPALDGYTVTVEATDLGTVTLAGVDVTNGGSKKFAANSTAKLVATPVEGATFVGWVANGTTTVSTSATYNAPVIANVTYTPEFVINDASQFTVTFMDAYANVVSSQTVASGADITIPAVPARPGYVADGWSLTNDEIAALSSAATITAKYTADKATTYTINAPGCTITAAGKTANDTIAVPFDTKVTVTNDSATAFAINGVNVAYGTSYTFFATADVTINVVTNAVTATPQVVALGVGETTTSTGLVKAVFKASRTMTDDCKFVSAGYVFGKGDLGEITLDDVTGTTVKAAYVKTTSNQFSLTYSLKAQTGTMTARAFLVYKDAQGTVQTVYAEVQNYTYA